MKKAGRGSIGAICPAFRKERQLLLSTLELLDEKDLSFRPSSSGRVRMLSVREILFHILDADRRLVDAGLHGRRFTKADFICDESASAIAAADTAALDLAGIRAALEASWGTIEQILRAPIETLERRIWPDKNLTLLAMLGDSLAHASSHRGQLWTYLELMGRVPPRA